MGLGFYPYGESKTGVAGDDREQFATYTRDGGSGLDYADQRWYASGVGRFTVADTSGLAESYSYPQSWNQYAYVEGDAVNNNDPSGLVKYLEIGSGINGFSIGQSMKSTTSLAYFAVSMWHEAGPMRNSDTFATLRRE